MTSQEPTSEESPSETEEILTTPATPGAAALPTTDDDETSAQ
jgi:hypothetical protein